MKAKIISALSILLYTSVTSAAVIGWEVHNNTKHAVDVELWKHCMSDSPHDGQKVLAAGASYNYEELGSVNHGTCFFEPSFIMVSIYNYQFKKSFVSKLGCFTDGPQERSDGRVKMTATKDCKVHVRFDING